MAGHAHESHRHSDAGQGGEGHGGEHPVVPVGLYVQVVAWLMGLLVITLAAAALDLGPWNLPIAMLIAVVKMMIVVLYFMHVRWSSRLLQVFAGSALMWLAIMFVLTLTDYASRGWLPGPGH